MSTIEDLVSLSREAERESCAKALVERFLLYWESIKRDPTKFRVEDAAKAMRLNNNERDDH